MNLWKNKTIISGNCRHLLAGPPPPLLLSLPSSFPWWWELHDLLTFGHKLFCSALLSWIAHLSHQWESPGKQWASARGSVRHKDKRGDERNKPQRQTVTNTHRPTTPASPLAITKVTRVLQLFYLRWKRVCGVSQRVSWAQGVICTEQKQKLYESETSFHFLSFQGLSNQNNTLSCASHSSDLVDITNTISLHWKSELNEWNS